MDLKAMVVGDYACGKTSIIKRYVEGHFSPNYKMTIGVDFAVKKVEFNRKTTIQLQIWDLSGQERFGAMTRHYYHRAVGCAIVFDLTRPLTFDSVIRWRDDVNSKVQLPNGERIPMILIANKCDVAEASINKELLDEFAREEGFVGWFATSAQDNVGVDDAVRALCGAMVSAWERIEKEGKVPKENPEVFSLDEDDEMSPPDAPRRNGAAEKSENCC